MKITKKIAANEEIAIAEVAEATSTYAPAIDLVSAAIESLASLDTDVARDSIANLSVVLFDLKSAQ